jgi:hypothetical protein
MIPWTARGLQAFRGLDRALVDCVQQLPDLFFEPTGRPRLPDGTAAIARREWPADLILRNYFV